MTKRPDNLPSKPKAYDQFEGPDGTLWIFHPVLGEWVTLGSFADPGGEMSVEVRGSE